MKLWEPGAGEPRRPGAGGSLCRASMSHLERLGGAFFCSEVLCVNSVILGPESSLLPLLHDSQCFGGALGLGAPLVESPVAVGCDFL